MSASSDYAELGELIFVCLSGAADQEQVARLEARLAGDEEARRYYGEFLVIYAGLRQSPASLLGSIPAEGMLPAEDRDGLPVSGSIRETIRDIRRPPQRGKAEAVDGDLQPRRCSPQDAAHDIENYAQRQLEAFLDQQRRDERLRRYDRLDWGLADAVALTVQAIGRFFGAAVRAAKVGLVLATIAFVGLIVGLHIHANRVVATLTDSAGAVWDSPPENARLRCGWMRLEDGFAQIAFKKGAEVILQAPCEFELRSPNAMFLQDGQMTAHVPKRATGFTVSTPTSCVVDFGTEFGLLTGGGRTDEVHVFDGSVCFKSARRRRGTRWDQPLKKGQAATIDTDGHVHVQALKDRPTRFVRTLSDANKSGKPAGQLDLADMVGGGSGRRRGNVGRGIDPSSGMITSTYGVSSVAGSGYRATPALAFIDGVFVPDGGDGPFSISSTGTAFSRFPDTSGTCYRAIINGAMFQAMPSPAHPGRLAVPNAEAKVRPSIGMHASAGITFDLDRIRQARPRVDIAAFRALCGVSETVAEFAPPSGTPRGGVTFWVLVDGQTRFTAILKPIPPESEWIDVNLSPEDRFLTLATTGAGDCTFCWGMYVEPTLELRIK
jgi:hypothetical protein